MPNVILEKGVGVDLYVETGIDTVETLQVVNLGGNDVRLSATETGLINDHIPIGPKSGAVNDVGDTQAWALCVGGGAVNVKVVV